MGNIKSQRQKILHIGLVPLKVLYRNYYADMELHLLVLYHMKLNTMGKYKCMGLH